jgi:hypothetical protein
VAKIHKMMIRPNLSILLILLVQENPSMESGDFSKKLKKNRAVKVLALNEFHTI